MKTFFLTLLLLPAAHASVSLKEAFTSALKNMETLKRSGAQVSVAQERKRQAIGALLPTVSGVGNKTWLDTPEQSGVNRAFVLTQQHSAALRLQQPLLRGGSYSGLQARSEEVLLARLQKDATELDLYQLVIDAYYRLHFAQADLKNLADLLKFSQERVKEIRSFTQVGRSRRAELIQAEAQLLSAQTQHRDGERTLNEAQRSFAFFTGLVPNELPPLETLPSKLPKLTELLEDLKARPDLKARRQEVSVADKGVQVAKGGHWPSLDLVSNYYFDRTGVLQTSEWDLALVVSVPLYQGGTVNSQVKEALAQKRVAELNSEETLRAARRDLTVLYENYHILRDQLAITREALKKSEEAWRLNLKDYRNGLVTNLEVLQGLNLYIQTRRSLDSLITQSHLTYRNLKAAVGELP